MSELTLTIYPRQPRTPGPGTGWADWRRDQDRECRMAHDKRFSDAELAAEWQQALGQANMLLLSPRRNGKTTAAKIAETLYRFARAPHYYEEQE